MEYAIADVTALIIGVTGLLVAVFKFISDNKKMNDKIDKIETPKNPNMTLEVMAGMSREMVKPFLLIIQQKDLELSKKEQEILKLQLACRDLIDAVHDFLELEKKDREGNYVRQSVRKLKRDFYKIIKNSSVFK